MSAEAATEASIDELMRPLGVAARDAARRLARADGAARDRALAAAAAGIRGAADRILAANALDLEAARQRQLSPAMLDRLALDPERVAAMAAGVDAIRELPDPVGQVIAEWDRPNGLRIHRVRVPLAVIGIIYESRPNVTADASALCLKAGNAVILRGGSESFHSSRAIYDCFGPALRRADLPVEAIQMVPTTDRAAVGFLLSEMADSVDVLIPRGGKSLIERVQRDARVPVLGHLEGLCHVYVDRAADPAMAEKIVLNAKLRRTGICGAAETLLIDEGCDDELVRGVLQALRDAGCEVRADAALRELDPALVPADEADWSTEYLDAVISARTVPGVDGALAHIERYGSGHTESIVTNDGVTAERFLAGADSAIVLHNASTQFADGGEFGMGAEIGIATGRLHARGPVGAEQLTSFNYRVRGAGQVRP